MGRDASEKLFLSDKTFLGNHALRSSTEESAASKIFIEFVALIIRNRMYNYLKDAMKAMAKKPNYMTVPAAIRELDKIEMSRQLDGVFRDHFEKRLRAELDYEFEEYCTEDDYYQPVVEDFGDNLEYCLEEWCKENGFEFVSCEGDGDDDGYEPKFRKGWY